MANAESHFNRKKSAETEKLEDQENFLLRLDPSVPEFKAIKEHFDQKANGKDFAVSPQPNEPTTALGEVDLSAQNISD